MKKQFISYVVISSILLSSLLLAYFVTDLNREERTLTNPDLIANHSYVLCEDTIPNYQTQKIAGLSFNDSHKMNKIKSIDFNSNFAGGYLTVGSIENETYHKHGLLQLIEFDDTIILEPEPYVSNVYLNTTVAQTEYLMCQTINSSFDGSNENPTVFALKEIITTNTFDVDIFEVDSGNFLLNSTIAIENSLFGSIMHFAVFDTNNDDFFEIYILGENATNTDYQLLAEYEYNQISEQYEISEILEWDANDLEIYAMEYIVENSTINFIISGVNSTSINSFLVAISIERNDVRQFTFESIYHLDYGSNIFRTYNMKLFNTNESSNPGIALFGAYYTEGINHPSFVKVSFQSGVFSSPEIASEYWPGWSLDGLITDIDMDNTDEIILTTHDLISLSRSEFMIYSPENMQGISSSTSDTYKIRSCDSLSLGYANIGSCLGFNSGGDEHYIEFHLSQYIPISIRANSYFLTEKTNNSIQIEILDLHGIMRSTDDFTIYTYLESHPEINQSSNIFPDEIMLNLSKIDEEILEDILIFEIYKNDILIYEHSFTVEVITLPSFDITLPVSPIVLRKQEDATQSILLTLNNLATVDLKGNVTIETETSDNSNVHHFYLRPQETVEIDLVLDLIFDGNEDYSELITITLRTYMGSYQFTASVEVKNSLHILSIDLLNAFWIVLSVVIVSFFAFLLLIYKINKESIRKHIANDEPLKMDIPWFKDKAVDNLVREYSVTGNWEMGIKLTKEYFPEKLVQFHQYRARELLLTGQNLAQEGKFFDTLINWQHAKESLVVLKNEQWLDIIDWILDPLTKIVDARKMKNKEKKAVALLNEFQILNGLSEQSRRILGIELTIPLYFVAEDLGLAYNDSDDLQNSLIHLQYAYQYAPDFYKNRIIKEITRLIGLGVQPKEMAIPQAQDAIKDRIARRMIRCFSCGTDKAFGEDICPNCGVENVQCSVCKLPISFGVETAECPHCENIAHREHLLEWIKVKGSCPVCQRHLKAADIKPSVSSEEE